VAWVSTGAIRALAVLSAACTVEMYFIYFALGIPLDELDWLCVNQDIVKSVMDMP